MNVEQSVEQEFAGETELLVENLFHRHFVYLTSHMTWDGNWVNGGGKPATDRLGTSG
jgi:hypothetical protein